MCGNCFSGFTVGLLSPLTPFLDPPWQRQVYGRLLEAGLQPISTTYTALISAYAKGGQLDRALDTFKQMVRF